jgi:hypothetical protein
VRELLIIHRDTRKVRLDRHDGSDLVPVPLTSFKGKKAWVSEVVPLAFQRKTVRGAPRTVVWRTEGGPDQWTI